MSVLLVSNGRYVYAVLDVHVAAAAEATTFAWRAGAYHHGLCDEGLGWRLDVSGGATEIAPNDARDVVLRASSYDRVACAREPVGRCGEPVKLFLMTDDDVVLATFETRYECLFPL